MLYFIQSNRLERLMDRLCLLLGGSGGDPLRPREIVVQNPGMARWVSQQIALRTGIAANLRFPLPARFIWQLYATQLAIGEDERLFDRSVMLWRILDELPRVAREDGFAAVAGYLRDDQDGRKAFQLAGRIADLFDQYLVYRPDMLLEWESSPDPEWQALLWRKLTAACSRHRARYHDRFRRKAQQGKLDPAAAPRQVFLFGISSLAPVYLETLHGLGTVAEVYLFHLSPCREYWADLASAAELARKRAAAKHQGDPAIYRYYDTGNPLLASQGKVGREFVGLLHSLECSEIDDYEDPPGQTMLSCLQRDILDLLDHSEPGAEKRPLEADDRSVQFHSCHSRMREVQVLHDRLLEMFENDPELKPGDILVMAPGIEEYAAPVAAVFDAAEGGTFIPWSLADRSMRAEEPLVESFLSLFGLCTGRCSGPEVAAFLETETVMRRFSLDEEGLAIIRRWVGESGIRWGLDADHRRIAGCAMAESHTWSFGMDRLFMGYFMGETGEVVRGISPFRALSSDHGVILGKLAAFLDALRTTRERLAGELAPAQWTALLLELLDDFYDPGPDEDDQQALAALRETVRALEDDCRLAGYSGRVSLELVRNWLEESCSEPFSGQAFLSGRVTFCNMVPMRSVPFRVICLLGMNDSDYPRIQPRVSFDLLAQDPRPGDRSRRDDDRYLFLEALLSARRVLYLSWIGRDQRDNSIRPPSTVVSELIDYVRRSFVSATGAPVDLLITEHPLQPFSRRCFDGSPGSASYAAQWLPVGGSREQGVFAAPALPDPPEEWRTVDLGQLVRFWSHPVRHFLRQRLDLMLGDDHILLADSEPFRPDHLARYVVTDRLVDALLDGQPPEKLHALLQAEGSLPHGSFGRNLFEEMHAEAAALVPAVMPLVREPRDPLEVDLALGPFHLRGWLSGLYAEGCVRYRPANLKGKDLLQLWIEHLAGNALDALGAGGRSVFIARDRRVAFGPVARPLPLLQALLDLYWQGLATPLHFYPESSRAWFDAGKGGNMAAARKTWNGGFRRRGEGEDTAYMVALQGAEPLDGNFEQLAAAVYGPLHSHLEDDSAAL